ncbi:hypothetical protein FRC12_024154 [Ceratobasidium sp. 428]|nr:hypothetical protein FRC12_024154 [Ceratobasidium sp. 428]
MQEIISGAVPYVNLKDLAVITAVSQNRLPARPQELIPSESVDGDTLWSLLIGCWAHEPASRPTAKTVQRAMANITPEGLIHSP